MKRAVKRRIVALSLAAALLLSAMAGCGGKNEAVHRAEGTVPTATEAEDVMNTTAALSIRYYLTARAYLDAFLHYDTDNMSEAEAEEFTELLNKAVDLFADVEQLSEALKDTVDVWEAAPRGPRASYHALSRKVPSVVITAHAAADNASTRWAQDIVNAYDKARATGRGVRTLAEQLGTDARHAYAQLKQATAILDGADYQEIADKANTAVQVGTALKAAGTGAGLVIAVAAAPAAGVVGAVAKTGGVVCAGINTVLEVGSAGSIIYHNGEDNEISIACDSTEQQFAPVGQVFSIMGVGQALKDVGTTGKSVLENGYKALSEKDKQALGENGFTILSSAGTSLSEYVNDGTVLSGTFTKTEKGFTFTLADTLTGADKSSEKNVTEVLENGGMDKNAIKEAISGDAPAAQSSDSIPGAIGKAIMDKNQVISDTAGSGSAADVTRTVSTTLSEVEQHISESSDSAARGRAGDQDVPDIDMDSPVPDDAWDGDSVDFVGKDGSVTTVYDSGSVVTVFPDGSTKGVDYKGNTHTTDADGNNTLSTPAGEIYTQDKDGTISYTDAGGLTTTVHPDGSFSESSESLGVVKEYDSDGHCTGIGFIGSDERIGTNEDGDFEEGTIKGPNDATLTISHDGLDVTMRTPDGKQVSLSTDGVTDSDGGMTETVSITGKDGESFTSTTNTTANRDGSGDYSGDTVITTGEYVNADGDTWTVESRGEWDADGNPMPGATNVSQFTGADGSTLWMDGNSGALEYYDPNTGDTMVIDSNGNLTTLKDSSGNDWNVVYDDEGNVKWANITFDDGATLMQSDEGGGVFTLPDGTQYVTDADGNVYVNGQSLDGGDTTPDLPDVPDDGGYADVPPVDDGQGYGDDPAPDEGGDLSARNVAGTYHISGYEAWDDYEDDDYDSRESLTVDVTFSAQNGGLVMTANGISLPSSGYDPATGTCSFADEDGMLIYMYFSKSGGTYSVTMDFDNDYGYGRSYGHYSGSKR